jgi:ribonucleotide reductase alpha subunit
MASRAYCSWMQQTAETLSRIYISLNQQTRAANNGSGPTRTAASARSTSTSTADPTARWIGRLRQSVVTATRFLDDVVEANAYVPAVPQLKEAAHRARRIGLGIMGLADLMYHVGVRYGSPEGQEFGAQVMEFVRYHDADQHRAGRERGPFPAIEGSIYDMDEHEMDSRPDAGPVPA